MISVSNFRLVLKQQDMVLLVVVPPVVVFLISFVVIFAFRYQTSNLRQKVAQPGSIAPPLSTANIFASDPSRGRELGSQYFCSYY